MKFFKGFWRVLFIVIMIILDLAFIASIANFDVVVTYTQDQVNNEIAVEGLVQISAFFTQLSKIGMDLVVRITNATANADGTYNVQYELIGPNFHPDFLLSYFALIGFFLTANAIYGVIGAGSHKLGCILTSLITIAGCVLYLLGPNAFSEFSCHLSVNGTDYLNYKLPIPGISGGLVCVVILGFVVINLILVLIFGEKKKANVTTTNSITK